MLTSPVVRQHAPIMVVELQPITMINMVVALARQLLERIMVVERPQHITMPMEIISGQVMIGKRHITLYKVRSCNQPCRSGFSI